MRINIFFEDYSEIVVLHLTVYPHLVNKVRQMESADLVLSNFVPTLSFWMHCALSKGTQRCNLKIR